MRGEAETRAAEEAAEGEATAADDEEAEERKVQVAGLLPAQHLVDIPPERCVIRKGAVQREHRAEEDAEPPPVDLKTVGQPADDLGSPPAACARLAACGVLGTEQQGQPEVGKLRLAATIYENVLRLEIAVDDAAGGMKRLEAERARSVPEARLRLVKRRGAHPAAHLGASLLQMEREGSACKPLERHAQVVGRLVRVVYGAHEA